MLYRATHTTRYHYEAPVSQCQSEVRLTPRSLPWQTVLESAITTTPEAGVGRTAEGLLRQRGEHASRSSRATTASSTVATSLRARRAAPRAGARRARRGRRCGRSWPRTRSPERARGVRVRVRLALRRGRAGAGRVRPRRASTRAGRCWRRWPSSRTGSTPSSRTSPSPRRSTPRSLETLRSQARRVPGLLARHDRRAAVAGAGGALRERLPAQRARATWVPRPRTRGCAVFVSGSGLGRSRPDQRRDARHRPHHAGVGARLRRRDARQGIALGGGKQVVEVEVRVEPIDG